MNEPDMDFVRYLSNIVRSDAWNKVMRTPKKWREMYDAGLTVREAAAAPENWKSNNTTSSSS